MEDDLFALDGQTADELAQMLDDWRGTRLKTIDPQRRQGPASRISLYIAKTTATISARATTTVARSGSTISGTFTITSLSTTADLLVGMTVSGTGVTAGSTVVSIDSASQVTISLPTTATATNTMTFTLLVLGSGAIEIYGLVENGAGTFGLFDEGWAETGYNVKTATIASGTYVIVGVDPYSGRWVILDVLMALTYLTARGSSAGTAYSFPPNTILQFGSDGETYTLVQSGTTVTVPDASVTTGGLINIISQNINGIKSFYNTADNATSRIDISGFYSTRAMPVIGGQGSGDAAGFTYLGLINGVCLLFPSVNTACAYAVVDVTNTVRTGATATVSGLVFYGGLYISGTFSGGTGTVTSISGSGGTTGLTLTGGPITTSGTLTLGGTLIVANGGTGNTTFIAYAVLLAGTTATGAFQDVGALGTSGQVLTSAGAGAKPTWTSVAGTGTVTSVDGSGGSTGLTLTGGAITASGTLTLGGTLVAANGGTGRASHTAYAVLCGGTTTTAAQQSIASVGTSGQVLTSNGAGALPTFQSGGGGSVTSVNASGGTTGFTFSGGPVTGSGTLTMSGTLIVANGGTGATTFATGAVLVGQGAGAITTVSGTGTTGQVLTSTGAASAPTWQSNPGAFPAFSAILGNTTTTSGVEKYYVCDTTLGGFTVTLTTGANNRQNIRNNAVVNIVTVAASSGTINGTTALSAGQSATYVCDGTNWFVF